MKKLDTDPTNIFGSDLSKVFGTKSVRKHISTFTNKELEKRIKKLPETLPTDCLGTDPTFFEVTNYVLQKIRSTKALHGIDLDWHTTDDFKIKGMKIHPSHFIPVSEIVKNNKVQRAIKLQKLVRNLLFRFRANSVQPGTARYNDINKYYYLNDSQHRLIACIILGIREFPLHYVTSTLRSVDVKQFADHNLNNTPSSNHDQYTCRVQSMEALLEEDPNFNVSDSYPEDIISWNVYGILEESDGRCIEKGGQGCDAAQARESTASKKLEHLYRIYGHNLFQRSIEIHTQVWYTRPIAHQNIGGICEYIKTEEQKNVLKNDSIALDMAIIEALEHRYPKPKGKKHPYGLYSDAIKAFNTATANSNISIQYEKIVAAGIHKIIKITHPNIKWAPIKSNNKIIATQYLKSFRVAPKP